MNHDTYGPHDNESPSYDAGGYEPPPPPRPGLAWERRDELGPGPALLATIRDVVIAPGKAFSEMHTEGGWAEPLGFALVVGSIFIWIAQMWDMLARSVLGGFSGFEVQEIAAANAQEIWIALSAPFMVAASTFFAAAVVHVLLLVFGGAPRPYETTFRVFCYSWAVGVFNMVPICGVFIGAIWRIVVQIIGVRDAQGVPVGRAAAAVLIPVILTCFCLFLMFVLVVGAVGLTQMGM